MGARPLPRDLTTVPSSPSPRSKKVNKGIGITSIHSLDDQLWHAPDFT